MTPRDVARMMRQQADSSDRARFAFSEGGGADVNSIAQKISSQAGGISARSLRALAAKSLHSVKAHPASVHSSRRPEGRRSHPPLAAAERRAGKEYAPSPQKKRVTEPTPAWMPKHKEHGVAGESFAALGLHELPVVREYSAGGLIFNKDDEVAIIARHSRSGHVEWCLPKGHIEKGETPEQTAVREVHEETGIQGEVKGSIATIDYWFTGDNQRIHKLVHHYVLRQTSGHLTVKGDPDHEAEDAAWVPAHQLTAILSYPNERRVVSLYFRKYRRRS